MGKKNRETEIDGLLSQKCEAAFLIEVDETRDGTANSRLKELKGLVSTLHIPIVGEVTLSVSKPHPGSHIGSGKAAEIGKVITEKHADLAVLNAEISPSVQRNLESIFGVTVIDRREVIIDIFAQRAVTREARLQTEIASLRYHLPRLKRAWTHLSRQRGGSRGTRGEGEKQIEIDRRLIEKRLHKLSSELNDVRKQRSLRRSRREKIPIRNLALAGYTNAGKSSILNALTTSEAFVEDKLFATLDPLSRRLVLPGGREVSLTDTVGFIRDLPHELVDAFHATLEEVAQADVILFVIDASDTTFREHIETSERVLKDLEAYDTPRIVVFNKIDRVDDGNFLTTLKNEFPDAIFISAVYGKGFVSLFDRISDKLSENDEIINTLIPHGRGDLIAMIHRRGRIIKETVLDSGIQFSVSLPLRETEIIREFMIS